MTKYLLALLWIPMAITKIVLILLGLVFVPVALLTRHMTLDGKADTTNHWPDVFWLWGNDEEHCPDWWKERAKQDWWTRYWPQFWWYAVRNPVNNLRYVFKDREASIQTDWQWKEPMEAPQLIKHNEISAYRWSWSGPFSGYRRVWITEHPDDGFESPGTYTELWLGFKVGSTVPGLGFAMQYRRNRDIGK